MSDEYEYLFDSDPSNPIQIHGWAPVSTNRLLKPVDELIAMGVLRKIERTMTDQIPGEVLVPQSRFIPKCECFPDADFTWGIQPHGASYIFILGVTCVNCGTSYEQELPTGVPSIPSGNMTTPDLHGNPHCDIFHLSGCPICNPE